MDRRLLAWIAAFAALAMALGLLALDVPLARAVHASGWANAAPFEHALAVLDASVGMHAWYWLAGCVAMAAGALGLAWRRDARWPRAFLAAGLVQVAALHTMIAGKNHFGRLRPSDLFAAGDWSQPAWFAGGGSFPSGHGAFYFGLLLPLAAACPIRWLRVLLLAIAAFVLLARIDLERHFLSDLAASALIASVYALALATLLRRWWPAPRGADGAPVPS
jgi:membrane-associated phospholipid phosphatase